MHIQAFKNIAIIVATLLTIATPSHIAAYPIDAYPETQIRRLEYYRLANEGEIQGKKLPQGALLTSDQVKPRLVDFPDLVVPEKNSNVSKKLKSLIVEQPENYGIAVLDITDPNNPIYAEHNGNYTQNVGSVGKVLAVAAFLNALAEHFPDIEQRKKILTSTLITADEYSNSDHHTVRFFDVETRELTRTPLKVGGVGNLYEYMDWALSPSSNSAAAMLQRELIVLSHFKQAYPPSDAEREQFLSQSTRSERGDLFLKAMNAPLIKHGIDTERLRQGSLFTRTGKSKVLGTSSRGNPRELIKMMFLIEKGEFIDEFSSTELKRLLYLTERRIRYASHPNLKPFALYFKTGSLYSCQPEEGFKCAKYKGNKKNILASIAIVEAEQDGKTYHYLVVVQSNVLKVNSAVAHQTLASRVHKMIVSLHEDEKPSE